MRPLSATLSALLLTVLSAATPFYDCGYTGVLPAIKIGNCDSLPCIIKRGTPQKVEVRFIAAREIKAMSSGIYGYLDGLPIPVDFDDHMCDHLSEGRCPASPGEQMSYSADVVFGLELPPLDITVQWLVSDPDRHDSSVLCVQVPVRFT